MGPFRRFYKRQVAKRGTPAHLSVTGALSQPVLALSNCSRKGRFAMSSLTSWSPHVLSLLRVASGAAFMAHGTMKRSEEHTSELQSLMRSSYAVFCLKKKKHSMIHYQ